MEIHGIDLWEHTAKNASPAYKEYFDAETTFLKVNLFSEAIVLDLCCGYGRIIPTISPLVREVIGIDNDVRAIELAKENTKNLVNTSILLQDATHMTFQDNQFDVVFCGMTFVNFAEKQHDILSEIKRVLKSKGIFIFSVFNEYALSDRQEAYKDYPGGFTIQDSKKGLILFNDFGATSQQFTQEEITVILAKDNLKIKEIKKGKIYYLISAVKK